MAESDLMEHSIYVNGSPIDIGEYVTIETSRSGNRIERWYQHRKETKDSVKKEIPVLRSDSSNGHEKSIGIEEKCLLTLEEAAKYTGIGVHKLRELSSSDDCNFVLWNGSKRMFKREKLKNYLYSAYSI